VWAKTDLLRKAGDWLSGTLLWGMWLRAAGMRVGRDSEISTIIDVVPELVSIGDSTFCADGIYLGGPRVHRGTVTLAETRLGRGLFLGNHVVIPGGVHVPDDVLLGVCTVAHHRIEAGSTWFGHPPFQLSRPIQPKLDPSLTHRPSLLRLVNRWFWELGRFAIPVAPALAALELARLFAAAQDRYAAWTMALFVTPALVAAAAAAMCAIVLVMKWLLLGRVRPGEHALWSCWCSRWDFHYTLWDRLATPVLSRLEGTLLLAWYLRATGMRIGKRVGARPRLCAGRGPRHDSDRRRCHRARTFPGAHVRRPAAEDRSRQDSRPRHRRQRRRGVLRRGHRRRRIRGGAERHHETRAARRGRPLRGVSIATNRCTCINGCAS
jgi:non-ribosomal peptide synthetase-like protein